MIKLIDIQWLSELIECGNLQIGKPTVALWIPMIQKWLIPHLIALNVNYNLRYQTLQKHKVNRLLGMMFESGTLNGKGRMEDLVVKKIPEFFLHFTP